MAKSTPKKSTKPKVSKAELAERKAEVARLKNSRDYAELAGLLTQDPHKKTATVDWLNKHLPSSEALIVKVGVKERERFILALIRAGKSGPVINDLRDLPSRQWKTLFAEMAGTSPAKAIEKLKALKPKDFAAFCVTNDIQPVTSGKKGSISKPKTIPYILKKLEKLSEYLKL
jgi:hypothetical protein